MEITKLMGQVQTEEEKKKEREKTAKLIQSFSKNSGLIDFAGNNLNKALMFNPAKESEKAFLGSAMFNYVSPIEKELERQQEEREDREKWEPSFQKTQERLAQQQQNYKQMLIDVQVQATQIVKAEKLAQQGSDKHQVNIDAVIGSHAGTTKLTKNEQRDEDYTRWIEEIEETDLTIDDMTKAEIQTELIRRSKTLWTSGFNDWVKYTKLYAGKQGRKLG